MTQEVLILLATWNGESFLKEQLASIAEQTHRNWRILAADDGSTDSTISILEEFGAHHPGHLCLLRGDSPGSAKGNFFRLLREAPKAPYYAFCDQDDVWAPEKLSTLVAACQEVESHAETPVPCAVYSDLVVVNEELGVIGPSFMRQIVARPERCTLGSLLVENSAPGCAMLFNHNLRERFAEYEGPLDDVIMHDWWIALLAKVFGYLTYVPEPLVQYRQHGNNSLGSVQRGGPSFVLGKLFTQEDEMRRVVRQGVLLERGHGNRASGESAETLRAFASLPDLGKLARVAVCVRHGILKQTLSRRIYQLMRI